MAMKRICDICGKDAEDFSFIYDRKLDGSGPVENEWAHYDLCLECRIFVLERALDRSCSDKFEKGQLLYNAIHTQLK